MLLGDHAVDGVPVVCELCCERLERDHFRGLPELEMHIRCCDCAGFNGDYQDLCSEAFGLAPDLILTGLQRRKTEESVATRRQPTGGACVGIGKGDGRARYESARLVEYPSVDLAGRRLSHTQR